MTRTETIQVALKLCPVHWGNPNRTGPPLRYEPGRGVWPWTTRQTDDTGRANIDAEGKVIVAWMKWLDSSEHTVSIGVGYGEGMFVSDSPHDLDPFRATDRTDWLLTLAEAIVEVMG